MIAVIDYGVGNLFSLAASLKYTGAESVVTADERVISRADSVILPGVGAFADAREKLVSAGLVPVLDRHVRAGKPLLGICLGMQLLFERSYEYGEHAGLGYIKGEVRPIAPDLKERLKVPHMGWNSLKFVRQSPLYKYLEQGEYVYFVHSYYGTGCAESTTAVSGYGGIDITASVECGNVFGTQFHPEKSGAAGLKILRAFGELGR